MNRGKSPQRRRGKKRYPGRKIDFGWQGKFGGLATDSESADKLIIRGYRVIAMGNDTLPIERAVAGMFGGRNR